jgi:acetyltransferase-like isoleucine patch superfamily enzyme
MGAVIDIAPDARVSPLADIEDSVRGSRIVVGEGPVLNSGCVLYSGHGIRIGANALISANCTFAATDHAFADPDRPIREQGFRASRGGIVIGDDVWIGANVVLLDGAHVGDGSVIGAASLARGELPPFCIAHGVPARVRGWRRP